MTIAEMIEKKRELGMNNEMISEASGVPLSTVQKVFGGITKSPRKEKTNDSGYREGTAFGRGKIE